MNQTQRVDPTISACMIIKNEQPFLDGCLKSLHGLVDEIVIVDTGSTDSSIDIARAHGARVLDYAWHDDFAAARNFGLEAAGSEWILYIDADERLVDATREALRAGLEKPDIFAVRLLFRVNSNSTLYREYRLFRNDPRLRFKGAMHETILPDLAMLQREAGARVGDASAKLIHLGYDGEMTAKYRRNLPLLQASVVRDPHRSYYWKDLADTLAGLGETDAAIAAAPQGLARAKAPGQDSDVMHSALIYPQARLQVQRLRWFGVTVHRTDKPDSGRPVALELQLLDPQGEDPIARIDGFAAIRSEPLQPHRRHLPPEKSGKKSLPGFDTCPAHAVAQPAQRSRHGLEPTEVAGRARPAL